MEVCDSCIDAWGNIANCVTIGRHGEYGGSNLHDALNTKFTVLSVCLKENKHT